MSIIEQIINEFEALKQRVVDLERYEKERMRAEEEREKLIRELQTSLSEARTLKGILPICSSCKKIRDEKGNWRDVEAYIWEHSDAEFSHGICPDCMKRLYPEFHGHGK